jgi:hypothetical protein
VSDENVYTFGVLPRMYASAPALIAPCRTANVDSPRSLPQDCGALGAHHSSLSLTVNNCLHGLYRVVRDQSFRGTWQRQVGGEASRPGPTRSHTREPDASRSQILLPRPFSLLPCRLRAAVPCAPRAPPSATATAVAQHRRIQCRGILDSYRRERGLPVPDDDSAGAVALQQLRTPPESSEDDDLECPVECVQELKDVAALDAVLNSAHPNTLIVIDFYKTACGACRCGAECDDAFLLLRFLLSPTAQMRCQHQITVRNMLCALRRPQVY